MLITKVVAYSFQYAIKEDGSGGSSRSLKVHGMRDGLLLLLGVLKFFFLTEKLG
jgi:hypothetical protein